jgi:hypothetical protein
MSLSVFAQRELIGVTVATCPGRLSIIPGGISGIVASYLCRGTSDNIRGFAGGSRGRSRLLYLLLPLQLLRGPLMQV